MLLTTAGDTGIGPSGAASPWVTRWAGLAAPPASALDLACGQGRHARWLAQRGHPVTAVDRNATALATLPDGIETVEADLEQGPWPLAGRRYGLVVVTNYLWRPLFGPILSAVDAGGVLIYETFAAGQETIGRPSRADFLLQRGELLQRVAPLRIVAYEDGYLDDPGRFVQRIVAVREGDVQPPARWHLDA